ncbi:MAG TPA: hypothetical protein VF132_15035, partial [Rudaea sp.]
MTALLDQFGIGDARAREEAWRYSRNALRALEQQAFAPADSSAPLSAELAGRFAWPETEKRRVVFVNGGFSERHSRFEPDASVS